MARKIDPTIEAILKDHGFNAREVLWDCHGTWCMYHRALEQVAAKAGITFDRPAVLENDGKGKSVALCVFGRLNDREEWSVGEASPANCKNAYPWAMAEKRGKDRVILKLIGLHGLVYSEEEMDEQPPRQQLQQVEPPNKERLLAEIQKMTEDGDMAVLRSWGKAAAPHIKTMPDADRETIRKAYEFAMETINQSRDAA